MHKREKIIGDNNYSLLLPPVREAMPLCTKVAVLAGPSLTTLGQDVKGGMDKFAVALSSIDADELDDLIMKAVSVSKLTCNNQPINHSVGFERHFGDNRSEVYQVTLWVLWECVIDFFPQAENFTLIFRAKMKQGFQSPLNGDTTTG